MRTYASSTLTVMVLSLVSGHPGCAQTCGSPEQAEVAKALKDAKATLQQDLTASLREGTPISGKFEVEDGKLQLSVYTMTEGKLSEVIVDDATGKAVETEAITGAEDLTPAEAQREATAKAKRNLRTAVDAAIKAHAGSRAVSVVPALKEGHPVATITLATGDAVTTVSEQLD